MLRENLTRFCILSLICIFVSCSGTDRAIYLDESQDIEKRIDDLQNRLTIEEKVNLAYGNFYSGGIPRLGINKLLVIDGPVGVRLGSVRKSQEGKNNKLQNGNDIPKRTSALPSTLSLAASWDHKASYDYASIIADETLFINANVILGPGINIMRDPRCGRNFEYMGEDPYLTAEIAIAYTKGLQDKGVGVCLKHYVANENEYLRHLTTSNVDEKTLREVYVYPFERAIEDANAWSIMTANNLLNGTYNGNSKYGLKEILREQIGFDGVALTDWRSAYNAKLSAESTLDMTTGICGYVYGDSLLSLVKTGEVTEDMLNAMVKRILRLYFRTGVIDTESRSKGTIDTPENQKQIRRLTANSMVLLKNENNLLPLSTDKKIILTGPGAEETISGGGSSGVNKGEKRQTIADGLKGAFSDKMSLVNDSKKLRHKGDVVIYCATGQSGEEGDDMPDILLGKDQISEINRLGKLTDKLVVLLQNSTVVDMTEWNASSDAILITWLGGDAFGDAVADIVTGKVNPGGRLPCTFGNSINDFPCELMGSWPADSINDSPFRKPGHDREDRAITFSKAPQYIMEYKEKDLIGYRGFLANNIKPMYPFGYGLSYTSFDINDLSVKSVNDNFEVTCKVTNTGDKPGADVVQLYVTTSNSKVKKLRGFKKVYLNVGESKNVTLELRGNDLASFDVSSKKWIATKGDYLIELSDKGGISPKLETTINFKKTNSFIHP